MMTLTILLRSAEGVSDQCHNVASSHQAPCIGTGAIDVNCIQREVMDPLRASSDMLALSIISARIPRIDTVLLVNAVVRRRSPGTHLSDVLDVALFWNHTWNWPVDRRRAPAGTAVGRTATTEHRQW